MGMTNLLLRSVRERGVSYTWRRGLEIVADRLWGPWDHLWRNVRTDAGTLQAMREQIPAAGLISVVIPVYNPQEKHLAALLESLRGQVYPDWEACLVNTGDSEAIRALLREAAEREPRFRVFAHENEGIAGNTNFGIREARGEWIALCDHDDLLTADALWRLAECAVREAPDVIYTDEDKVTEDGRRHTDPHFKPDFCPDDLRASNYVCHLLAARRELMRAVGGLRPDFDGSQDHDLTLRLAGATARISHVRHICYHWRTVGGSMSHQHLDRCLDAGRRAVQEDMARIGWPGSVSVERDVLRLRYDVPEGAQCAVLCWGEGAAERREAVLRLGWRGVRAEALQTAAEVNEAAARAKEDFLLLVRADFAPQGADFLRELMMYAQRDDVGAVMPAVVDRRGRIVHAGGVVAPDGSCTPRLRGLEVRAGGWHMKARQSANVSVTAPCALLRRDHFLPIGANWTDWCLALGERGLRHVYTPHARAVHRGPVSCQPASAWGQRRDPCWHPQLDPRKADYSILREKQET